MRIPKIKSLRIFKANQNVGNHPLSRLSGFIHFWRTWQRQIKVKKHHISKKRQAIIKKNKERADDSSRAEQDEIYSIWNHGKSIPSGFPHFLKNRQLNIKKRKSQCQSERRKASTIKILWVNPFLVENLTASFSSKKHHIKEKKRLISRKKIGLDKSEFTRKTSLKQTIPRELTRFQSSPRFIYS